MPYRHCSLTAGPFGLLPSPGIGGPEARLRSAFRISGEAPSIRCDIHVAMEPDSPSPTTTPSLKTSSLGAAAPSRASRRLTCFDHHNGHFKAESDSSGYSMTVREMSPGPNTMICQVFVYAGIPGT